MAARHIHFIPWSVASGEHVHFQNKAQTWAQSSQDGDLNHDYVYEIVYAGDGTDLSTLPWGSEIYVHGHGASGDHEISSGHGANTSLKYDTVADLLIGHGLTRTWCGSIKLYSCHSGMATLGKQSFAAKFGQYMRFRKGYHLISYVGYLGFVTGYPIPGLCPNHLHKRVRIETPLGEIRMKTKWGKAFF